MHEELTTGLFHLTSLHDNLKKALVGVEPDHKLVKEIDRVTADNRKIAAMVTSLLNDLTVKAKSHPSPKQTTESQPVNFNAPANGKSPTKGGELTSANPPA